MRLAVPRRPHLTRLGASRRPRRLPLVTGAALTLVAVVAALTLCWLTADLPAPGQLIIRAPPDTTKIYDRQGRLLFEILDPRAGRRTRVALSDVPPVLRQAVIAVEDEGFYGHPGVDARGIARAAWQMAREGRVVSGGSTITQQLARAVLMSDDERNRRSLSRKLRESLLSLRVAAAYDKNTILELYLNEVYFGQLAYGVEAAAQTYFGQNARSLDLAQSAMLAGLIQSPAAYNPLVARDAAKARQAVVQDRMVAAGFIDGNQADPAESEPLHLMAGDGPLAAPHFVAYVRAVLDAVGVEAMIDTAAALGITTLGRRDRYGLALTLGGGEVTLLDLTTAFAGFAADGRRLTPRAILAVLDGPTFDAHHATADWPGVADAAPGPQAVPEPVAALITDILSDAARLPAFGEASVWPWTDRRRPRPVPPPTSGTTGRWATRPTWPPASGWATPTTRPWRPSRASPAPALSGTPS